MSTRVIAQGIPVTPTNVTTSTKFGTINLTLPAGKTWDWVEVYFSSAFWPTGGAIDIEKIMINGSLWTPGAYTFPGAGSWLLAGGSPGNRGMAVYGKSEGEPLLATANSNLVIEIYGTKSTNEQALARQMYAVAHHAATPSGPSSDGTKISELDSTAVMEDDDLFVIAREDGGGAPYDATYRITFADLITAVMGEVGPVPAFGIGSIGATGHFRNLAPMSPDACGTGQTGNSATPYACFQVMPGITGGSSGSATFDSASFNDGNGYTFTRARVAASSDNTLSYSGWIWIRTA